MLHHKRNIEATSVFAFLIQNRYKNKGSSISSEVTFTYAYAYAYAYVQVRTA